MISLHPCQFLARSPMLCTPHQSLPRLERECCDSALFLKIVLFLLSRRNSLLDSFVILISANAIGKIARRSRRRLRDTASKLKKTMLPWDLLKSQLQSQTIAFGAAFKDFSDASPRMASTIRIALSLAIAGVARCSSTMELTTALLRWKLETSNSPRSGDRTAECDSLHCGRD